MEVLILSGLILALSLACLRKAMISTFKISYYEAKLENRDVDISAVKNMNLRDIWRL